jgi:ABC-type Zn uptake system ZnuABC Zn-binding protein ZnuA
MRIIRNLAVSRFVVFLTVVWTAGTMDASDTARLRVVTSTTDLASLVREVGGNRVEVISLALGYEDPHFVPASAAWLLKLKRADLFMVIGLEMETAWLGELLKVQSPVSISLKGDHSRRPDWEPAPSREDPPQ